MPKQRSPVQLRREARKLIDRARKMESRQYEKLGRLVRRYHSRDYRDFDVETFRKKVEAILENKRV
jgi:hypothetical protein